MKRSWAGLLCGIFLLTLTGCELFESSPTLTALISPEQGIIPYTAQIIASAPPGHFTFALPDSTIEQTEGVLDVTIDRLDWEATVTWTDGASIRSTTVHAIGVNALPIINPPRINGLPDLWYLEPMERTLIDFTFRPSTMTAPRSGVDYAGEWDIVEITVTCSSKELCYSLIPDSVFTPPYESGEIHALHNNELFENACIVYPTLTFETAPNGLPYAPAAEPGYIYDGPRIRSVFHGVEMPAQTAVIRVIVRDDFGRTTSAEFDIPVGAIGDKNLTPYSDFIFYVSGKNDSLVHYSWCPRACSIPSANRLYFRELRNAVDSGRSLCSDCFEGQPGS